MCSFDRKPAEPVIKWTGSKRSQANQIIRYFPKKFDCYYEPFVGSGAMMRKLLDSADSFEFSRVVCSDVNHDLINLWGLIKNSLEYLSEKYSELWTQFNASDNAEKKKKFYYKIREDYNRSRNPELLLFLTRTCINGIIRYNYADNFNVGCHWNRPGIEPSKLDRILSDWSSRLKEFDVKFLWRSYAFIKPGENDFVYCDPPYVSKNAVYHERLEDNQQFFKWLSNLKCPWLLSYNGKSGDDDNTYEVPKELYDEHVYLESGNSSLKRMFTGNKNAVVHESLYAKH